MAKIINYYFVSKVNQGTEHSPDWREITIPVKLDWNEVNEEIAKREAHNGEYIIEDDGRPEPDLTTTDDILNALLGVTE